MMLKSTRAKVLLLTVIAISVITVLSKGYQRAIPELFKSSAEGAAQTPPDTVKTYNEELLKQFELVSRQLDGSDHPVSFSGTLNIFDKADTLDKPQTIPFKLFRKGNEMYYRLGRTEMVNSSKVYVYTDHDAKKIAVSDPKHLLGNNFIDTRKMREALLSEEYELRSSTQNGEITISLLNANHVTCKEYAVTFETVSNLPSRYFIRLSNISDPLRTDNEKTIDVRITETEAHPFPDLDKLIPVTKTGTGWKLKAGYSQYELITL